MFAPIYTTLKASAAVTAIAGTRIYMHGDAPQDAVKPYIVWQSITSNPQNTLSELPQVDAQSIQIDCYHQTQQGILDLATAVRDCIEPYAHVTSIPINEREPDTKLYRIAIVIDWWYIR